MPDIVSLWADIRQVILPQFSLIADYFYHDSRVSTLENCNSGYRKLQIGEGKYSDSILAQSFIKCSSLKEEYQDDRINMTENHLVR